MGNIKPKKNLEQIIANTEAHHRDLLIDIILSPPRPTESVQDAFIRELRELFSTVANRDEYLNENNFTDLTWAEDLPYYQQSYHIHIGHQMRLLWSEYRHKEGFTGHPLQPRLINAFIHPGAAY